MVIVGSLNQHKTFIQNMNLSRVWNCLSLFKVHLTKRSFLALLLQHSVVLSWGPVFIIGISNRYPDVANWCSASFSLSAALSILVAVYLMGKIDIHPYSIYTWSLISPTVTISLIFASELWFLIATCLLGGLYGNFLLGFYADFSELTVIRERGRVGGFVAFISILAMLFSVAVSIVLGFVGSVALCSLLGIFPLFTGRPIRTDPAKMKPDKTFSLKMNQRSKREFLLYLMPWLIYNIVNAILGRYQTSLLIDRLHIPFTATVVSSSIASCVGALVGGFVADLYGRKKALGTGLASYGIASALSGIFFSEIQESLLIFLSFALTGLSWGIFLVLYFLVVWEDLSNLHNNFLYYIGISLYPLAMGLAQFLPRNVQPPLANLALVSCVLIFSSNIFLVVADELLSSEYRKETDLFVYLEQVKRFFKEHYAGSS